MHLNIKGIKVQVADHQIARIVQQHFIAEEVDNISFLPQAPWQTIYVPRIGAIWPGQGGIFTGLARGRDGRPDYLLITGPKIDAMPWQQAVDAASAIEAEGHKDFSLPFRHEQALQFANVPGEFEKEWYFSGEDHATSPRFVCTHNFDNGSQGCDHKSALYRARTVRRILIV